MPNNFVNQALKWVNPSNTDQNLISSLIHMLSITLISMSLVELHWFTISGTRGLCAPYLSLTQFFTYGYTDEKTPAPIESSGIHWLSTNPGIAIVQNRVTDECLNETTVNMMRIIILLSFMAIIFSLCGFFIEIISPKSNFYYFVRKYALISTCTVLWIMAIIASCYYVAILLEESYMKSYPNGDMTVTYGYGFYLIAGTGGLNLFATFFNLMFMHSSTTAAYRNEDNYLIDGFDENVDNFNNSPPPPPYNVPPPPYAP